MPARRSAILLAAGHSRRMGRPKPLLTLGDRTFIEHCIRNLKNAGFQVVTVIRDKDEPLAEALGFLPTAVAVNPDPESDMSQSLRVGLKSLPPQAEGVLVALADHPLVSRGTLSRLAVHPLSPGGEIVIPRFQGRRGHPPLFSRKVLIELEHLPTLREVVRRDPRRVRYLETEDQGVLLDLDTPEEYQKACAQYGRGQGAH